MGSKSQAPSGSVGTMAGSSQPDPRLEVYKLEYERASIRYNDIYQALWQIFSYMSAITAAFLSFGGDRFQVNLFWFLTCTPLVFWFWGTYVPLDNYGNQCRARLGAIEDELNKICATRMDHYHNFNQLTTSKSRGFKEIQVKHIVLPLFLGLTLFWGWQAYRAASARTFGPLVREKATEVKIVTVDTEELKKLIESAKNMNQTPAGPPKAQAPPPKPTPNLNPNPNPNPN